MSTRRGHKPSGSQQASPEGTEDDRVGAVDTLSVPRRRSRRTLSEREVALLGRELFPGRKMIRSSAAAGADIEGLETVASPSVDHEVHNELSSLMAPPLVATPGARFDKPPSAEGELVDAEAPPVVSAPLEDEATTGPSPAATLDDDVTTTAASDPESASDPVRESEGRPPATTEPANSVEATESAAPQEVDRPPGSPTANAEAAPAEPASTVADSTQALVPATPTPQVEPASRQITEEHGDRAAVPEHEATSATADHAVVRASVADQAGPEREQAPWSSPAILDILASQPATTSQIFAHRDSTVTFDTVVLAVTGLTLLIWSVSNFLAGASTKLTVLGIVAANLAFAAALRRSTAS